MREAAIGALALLALFGAAGAGELHGLAASRPLVTSPPAVSPQPMARPEMRSYQPYSGLQFGFRPEPPRTRGIRPEDDAKPKVILPVPVTPLIEYGVRSPHAAQYYRYCRAGALCP